MSYPTEVPDYPTAVAAQEACMRSRASTNTVGPAKPIVASLDDLHIQLDALRDEAQGLLKRLEPVLGSVPPTGADGTPTCDGSKFANAISNGARKVSIIRQVLAEINDRLEF